MSNALDDVHWYPKVQPSKIRRLYESDARGLLDQWLLDEVGFELYMRCQSVVRATEAHAGRATCPRCETVIQHPCVKQHTLACSQCDWQLAWYKYRKTFENKALLGGGAMPAFRAFLAGYERTRTAQACMLLIDQLIHAFHWELQAGPLRPAGTNLIAGTFEEVVLFLDTLTYGADTTLGISDTRASWSQKLRESGAAYPWVQSILAGRQQRPDGD